METQKSVGTTLDNKFIGTVSKHSLVALWKPIKFLRKEDGIVIEKHRHMLAELFKLDDKIYTQCIYPNCQSYIDVTNFIQKRIGGNYKCIKNHRNRILVAIKPGESET